MDTRNRFEKLLYDACVIDGNCGSGDLHIWDILPKTGIITADEFGKLMLQAEKMSNELDGKQYQHGVARCTARFRDTMGAEATDVEQIW